MTLLFVIGRRLLFGIHSPFLPHLFLCALLAYRVVVSRVVLAPRYRLFYVLGAQLLVLQGGEKLVSRRNFARTLEGIEVRDHVVEVLHVVV